MSEQYTYAVARIRALEVSLFSDSTIDQLIACQNYDQALQFLEEKGWGDAESSGDAEKILTREEEKTWEVVKELSIGMEHFDVLSYPKLFHNLKAAVKEVCTGDNMFVGLAGDRSGYMHKASLQLDYSAVTTST